MDSAGEGEHDAGFTLIELMIVILVIGILLAAAVPTFFGARDRANDRAAQSNLRNANTNVVVYYTDRQTFTEDATVLENLDGSSLQYTDDLTTVASATVFVDVPAAGTFTPLDTVYLAAKSVNGSCFWIRTIGDRAEPRFAENDCSAVPASASFTNDW